MTPINNITPSTNGINLSKLSNKSVQAAEYNKLAIPGTLARVNTHQKQVTDAVKLRIDLNSNGSPTVPKEVKTTTPPTSGIVMDGLSEVQAYIQEKANDGISYGLEKRSPSIALGIAVAGLAGEGATGMVKWTGGLLIDGAAAKVQRLFGNQEAEQKFFSEVGTQALNNLKGMVDSGSMILHGLSIDHLIDSINEGKTHVNGQKLTPDLVRKIVGGAMGLAGMNPSGAVAVASGARFAATKVGSTPLLKSAGNSVAKTAKEAGKTINETFSNKNPVEKALRETGSAGLGKKIEGLAEFRANPEQFNIKGPDGNLYSFSNAKGNIVLSPIKGGNSIELVGRDFVYGGDKFSIIKKPGDGAAAKLTQAKQASVTPDVQTGTTVIKSGGMKPLSPGKEVVIPIENNKSVPLYMPKTGQILGHIENQNGNFFFSANGGVPKQITAKGLSIGRKSTNDVLLSDPTVSGNHATFRVINGELVGQSSATNGTAWAKTVSVPPGGKAHFDLSPGNPVEVTYGRLDGQPSYSIRNTKTNKILGIVQDQPLEIDGVRFNNNGSLSISNPSKKIDFTIEGPKSSKIDNKSPEFGSDNTPSYGINSDRIMINPNQVANDLKPRGKIEGTSTLEAGSNTHWDSSAFLDINLKDSSGAPSGLIRSNTDGIFFVDPKLGKMPIPEEGLSINGVGKIIIDEEKILMEPSVKLNVERFIDREGMDQMIKDLNAHRNSSII